MASAIRTAGLVWFAVLVLSIVVLATISTVKERKRGRRKDDEVHGGGGAPTDANLWAGDNGSPTD